MGKVYTEEIDRINWMDKMKEKAFNLPDLPCFLNLANPVNLGLFLKYTESLTLHPVRD